jgi:isopentenyl-diphosphate delta-isomerase
MGTVMNESVVLVNSMGNMVGTCEKLQAHQYGLLHLAFSLMLVRKTENGFEHLLQQRARDKYHSGGKWSNACCSHPREGERLDSAVKRRVFEELGVTHLPNPEYVGAMTYKASLDNGLTEHEYDHIFVQYCNDNDVALSPNPDEVSATRWVSEQDIKAELSQNPHSYTAWFADLLKRFVSAREQKPTPDA